MACHLQPEPSCLFTAEPEPSCTFTPRAEAECACETLLTLDGEGACTETEYLDNFIRTFPSANNIDTAHMELTGNWVTPNADRVGPIWYGIGSNNRNLVDIASQVMGIKAQGGAAINTDRASSLLFDIGFFVVDAPGHTTGSYFAGSDHHQRADMAYALAAQPITGVLRMGPAIHLRLGTDPLTGDPEPGGDPTAYALALEMESDGEARSFRLRLMRLFWQDYFASPEAAAADPFNGGWRTLDTVELEDEPVDGEILSIRSTLIDGETFRLSGLLNGVEVVSGTGPRVFGWPGMMETAQGTIPKLSVDVLHADPVITFEDCNLYWNWWKGFVCAD